ncbi:hypothetical protein [Nocardia sp. NPDC050435]|uniref:hypothetical protein n=1 Tax=Nocardia sp. NPDC050435 TaxID=3155040 RepID=UPI003402981C
MARFQVEQHVTVPGSGVFVTRLSSNDLEELTEAARTWALSLDHRARVVVLDRSVELFSAEGERRQLVDAIDLWAADPPPFCPECGEMMHAARMRGESVWWCHSCHHRVQIA